MRSGCAMAPAGMPEAEGSAPRPVGAGRGMSRGRRAVMTPRLCTWGFDVGRKLGVEGGGLDLLTTLASELCRGVPASRHLGSAPVKSVVCDVNVSACFCGKVEHGNATSVGRCWVSCGASGHAVERGWREEDPVPVTGVGGTVWGGCPQSTLVPVLTVAVTCETF